MRKVLFIIWIISLISSGCLKKEEHKVENTSPNNIKVKAETKSIDKKNNKNQIFVSPTGEYRAEAYGTDTSVTAGGLYPFEGIRVVNVENNDIIWKMEPGYYMVDFIWSPNGRYVGIYYEARIYGESIIFDTKNKEVIALPSMTDTSTHTSKKNKPQENPPDPYLRISTWKNNESVNVNYKWSKDDGDIFEGSYSFNVIKKQATY